MSVDRAEKRRWEQSRDAAEAAGSDPASEPLKTGTPGGPDDVADGMEPLRSTDEVSGKPGDGENPSAPHSEGARKGAASGGLRPVPTVSNDSPDASGVRNLDQLLSDEDDLEGDDLEALLELFDEDPAEDRETPHPLISQAPAEPDPTLSELDMLLGEDTDVDPAEIDAIDALLAHEVEEVQLDADPVMNELEDLLAADESDGQETEALEALLSEVTEDLDPVVAELDDALSPGPDDVDDEAAADVIGDFLADEAEEARLETDPVMSELDELLADEDGETDVSQVAALDDLLRATAKDLSTDAPSKEPDQDAAPVAVSPSLEKPVGSDGDSDRDEPADAADTTGLSASFSAADDWDDFDATDLFGAEPSDDLDSFDAFADLVRQEGSETGTPDKDSDQTGAQESEDAPSQSDAPEPDEADGDPIMSELEMILSADLDEEPENEQSTMLLSEVEANYFEPVRGKDMGDLPFPARSGAAEPDAEPSRKGEGQQHLDKVIARTGVVPRRRTRLWAWLIWLTILGGLIYAAFLPYSFEVGGDFIIQPIEQSQVRARTDGEIISLNVQEGDWVKTGDVMAVLSNWDEKKEVAVRKAELEGLRANLATLRAGAKPEEIAVAKEKVVAAEVQVDIAEQDLERKRQLLERNTISQASFEEAENELKVAKIALEQAKATLTFVSAAARASEIEAAEAAVRRSEQELEFSALMFEQTNIRAVSDGQIVSSLDEVPVGAFLVEGALFCVLEDNRVVKAEIEVPETDISEVKIGAEVELKLWSDAEVSLVGEVERLAPVAEERDFGRVVRVIVRVENPDGVLTSNTTGYAKISAREAPVWEVFTRMFVRFFRIELWSWIP